MRIRFIASLLIVIVVYGFYWYSTTASICPAPLPYRLGQFDSGFDLSREEAISHLEAAELIWEEVAGRELFVYDENTSFVVNFVFDERQEFADSEESETEALDKQRQENEKIFSTVERLQGEYQNLKNAYQERADAYEQRLKEFNRIVQQYNDRGGAPQKEYKALQEEQQELDSEVTELNIMSNELNSLAVRINELGQRGNEMIDVYNREVSKYNHKFGYEREFTQGDYQRNSINIYKFSSEHELVAVLAHEFGHALSIGHVDDGSALMYYLLADTGSPVVLSSDDRQALYEACGDGTDFGSVARRYIRGILGN